MAVISLRRDVVFFGSLHEKIVGLVDSGEYVRSFIENAEYDTSHGLRGSAHEFGNASHESAQLKAFPVMTLSMACAMSHKSSVGTGSSRAQLAPRKDRDEHHDGQMTQPPHRGWLTEYRFSLMQSEMNRMPSRRANRYISILPIT